MLEFLQGMGESRRLTHTLDMRPKGPSLSVGCGPYPLPGWTNADLWAPANARMTVFAKVRRYRGPVQNPCRTGSKP